MEEKYVAIRGNKIRYLEEGSAEKCIVLLHGLGGMAERWTPVIPLLSKKYRVIALDLIGYGHSDKPKTDYTPELFTEFILDFLDTLSVDTIFMVGTSLGGQIVAECAATQKNSIKKVVMISPAGMMKESTPTLDAYTMAALYPTYETVKTAYEMMMNQKNGPSQRTIDNFIANMSQPNAKMVFLSTLLGLKNSPVITKKLQLINIPTLIVWGSNDNMIPVKYAKDFVSAIKNSNLIVMEGCGHIPYEEKPDEFSKMILEFLGT